MVLVTILSFLPCGGIMDFTSQTLRTLFPSQRSYLEHQVHQSTANDPAGEVKQQWPTIK
jgi:hypothetical protein